LGFAILGLMNICHEFYVGWFSFDVMGQIPVLVAMRFFGGHGVIG
jgi:hypothetical protein